METIILPQQERKIRVLSDSLINKIAAGEVIDRPSSVVKELIENSIDAGADRITVLIKDGGRGLIQVIDNGSGMTEQDAILSFQRHATSKIQKLQDLEQIRTMGFRGEALASIASVSRVEMRTIPQGQFEGTTMTIHGGKVEKIERTGGNHGTTIAVKNLFFNTPARRKFMRAAATEYRHIISVLNRFTLSHPDIGFSLFNEDNEIFNLKPDSLQNRVAQVLGERVGECLIPLVEESAVMKLSGFLASKELFRKSRGDQYLFINRRYVLDRAINAAVISAYGEILPRGYFPHYLIFMEIDPERIDVNVHPTKSEVKFADQNMIFSLVRGAVRRALKTEQIIPDVQSQPIWAKPAHDDLVFPLSGVTAAAPVRTDLQTRIEFDHRPSITSRIGFPDHPAAFAAPSFDARTLPESSTQDSNAIWQLHNKYIFSQIKSGMVLIDQHAAHERILYEKAKQRMNAPESASQQLLFPQTIELSLEDFQNLHEILPFLNKLGFAIKLFGVRTVVVEGVPPNLRMGHEEKVLTEILDEYKERMHTESDMRERLAKSFACRAAIMTGERMNPEAMRSLIDQLFACENPYFCPHGRPTMITLSLDELDRRFERK